jgi:2-polyprenyl-3-methyl-5-hydroxy-6-metoxy-1,4-benzoquinol methylase
MAACERYQKLNPDMRPEDHLYYEAYRGWILRRVHGTVLDLGCGEGWLTKELAQKREVISILAIDKFSGQPPDNWDDKIVYLQHLLPVIGLKGQFDTIVSTEFIEHIAQEDLLMLLKCIPGWLKPHGRFLGSTPNFPCHSGNPFHIHEYHFDELREVFMTCGFAGSFANPLPYLTLFSVSVQ